MGFGDSQSSSTVSFILDMFSGKSWKIYTTENEKRKKMSEKLFPFHGKKCPGPLERTISLDINQDSVTKAMKKIPNDVWG